MDISARIRYNNGEIKIGNFNKHLRSAKEKFQAASVAYANNHMTVVGDLGTKVVEQLIEADATRHNQHFGDHRSRHEYSNENYPHHINRAMRKIWFAYADLGYDGVNGKKARTVAENLKVIIAFFEKRFGIAIHEKNI